MIAPRADSRLFFGSVKSCFRHQLAIAKKSRSHDGNGVDYSMTKFAIRCDPTAFWREASFILCAISIAVDTDDGSDGLARRQEFKHSSQAIPVRLVPRQSQPRLAFHWHHHPQPVAKSFADGLISLAARHVAGLCPVPLWPRGQTCLP